MLCVVCFINCIITHQQSDFALPCSHQRRRRRSTSHWANDSHWGLGLGGHHSLTAFYYSTSQALLSSLRLRLLCNNKLLTAAQVFFLSAEVSQSASQPADQLINGSIHSFIQNSDRQRRGEGRGSISILPLPLLINLLHNISLFTFTKRVLYEDEVKASKHTATAYVCGDHLLYCILLYNIYQEPTN